MRDIDNTNPKQDPTINYNILHNTVQHFQEIHMPVKLEHYYKYKHEKTYWITYGMHSIQFRDKLYKIHKMTDPTSQEHEAQNVNLKTYNNIFKQIIQMTNKYLTK